MIRTTGDALFCTLAALSVCGSLACGDDTAGQSDESSSTGDDDDDSGPSTLTTSASTTPADSSGDEADDSGSSTGTAVCGDGAIGQILPAQFVGTTLDAGDDFQGSCGGAGAPDLAFTFTAPEAGAYTIDTIGSAIDTMLYVLDGECGTDELACTNDPIAFTSFAIVDLAADQTVTLVVDGTVDIGGDVRLRIYPGDLGCPAGDLGSEVPATASGDLNDFVDITSSQCGGFGFPDATYLFTAPTDDTYIIDGFNSSFMSVISVLAGGCGGSVIACAADGLAIDLSAGQTVGVVIDASFEPGPFELNITTLGGACPDDDLGGTVPQSVDGDLSDADNTTIGSCGGAFLVDDSYSFTAALDGVYRFDTQGSAVDTIMHVHADSCDGAELRCSDDTSIEDTSSVASVPLEAGESVVVAIEGKTAGAYQLAVDQLACPDGPLDTTVPNTVLVTSFGNDNRLTGSCAGAFTGDAPDYVFTYVAPEAGLYAFDTQGTGFGTVVYALDGTTCVGDELGCAVGNEGSTTALALQLDAGQEINLVVDGATGSGGAIQLNIHVLTGTCPNDTLSGPLPISASGNTVGNDNAWAGACGGALNGDASYEFTTGAAGYYTFDTFGSTFDAVLSLRDGACDGPELACQHPNNFGQARIGRVLEADQTVIVTVDGLAEGNYQLHVDAPTCPEEDLGDEFPLVFDGTTAGAADKLDFAASCFASDQLAPDYTMSWTAPADGVYTFDTVGSVVASSLTVLDAACGGDTLGCASSFTGAVVELDAGQEVVIAVSGDFAAVGAFTLNIH